MRRVPPGAAAAALAAWTAACVAAGVWVVVARPHAVDDRAGYALVTAALLLDAAVTVTLVARLPRHPVTRALAAGLFLSVLNQGPEHLTSGNLSTAFANLGWLGGIPLLPLLFVLFPDGWPSGRRRWVARADVAAYALLVPVSALMAYVPAVQPLAAACGAVLFLTGIGSGVRLAVRSLRWRDRRPGVGAVAATAALGIVLFLLGQPGAFVFGLIVYGPPIAIGYGVLRHRLFGLDVAVRRVAIAVTTSLVLFALYLAATNVVAAVLPAVLGAVLLLPAYRVALRWTERRLYGDRRDPWLVLRRLGADLAAASPDEVPALVADRTRAGLRLPWVAVELDREGALVRVAASGVPADAPVAAFDLRHAGTRVGRLLVQPRRGQPDLDRRDRRALDQVAADVSPAVSAARLVDELTESRERLVTGREAERAWLRRELHDGLSPSLAGMSLALGAARQRLGDVPEDAESLLGTVQEEAGRAWQAVRGLLSDLRPPGLDDLGLAGALEDRARQLYRPDDFVVDLDVAPLPALPPAVEVAAYRITTEAMTNAARHSAGHHCTVAVTAGRELDIVVTDDGRGVSGEPGIGMRSMTERAADLGGVVVVSPAPGHGTVVHARLPLAVTS